MNHRSIELIMFVDCFIVMSKLKMLMKSLFDDAKHIFRRVYYGRPQILRFLFCIDGVIGVWVGDQKVSHLNLGINWMRSIFSCLSWKIYLQGCFIALSSSGTLHIEAYSHSQMTYLPV